MNANLGGSLSHRSSLDHLALNGPGQDDQTGLADLRFQHHRTDWLRSTTVWLRGQWGSTDAAKSSEAFSYDGLRAARGRAGADLQMAALSELHLSLGGDGGVTWVDAPFLHPDETAQLRPSYGAYAGFEWTGLASWVVSAATRADLSEISGDLEFSYRGSAICYGDNWSTRLTFASSYRDPTYVEAGSRFVDPSTGLILLEGTAGLHAPRIDSAELGAQMEIGDLAFAPTVYVAALRELMLKDFASLSRKSFRNDPDQKLVAGLETEATWTITSWMTLDFAAAYLHWLDKRSTPQTSTAAAAHNSRLTGWLGARTRFLDERLTTAAGAALASGREYDVRTGVPPQLLDRDVPTSLWFELSVGHQPFRLLPAWITLRAMRSFPTDLVEVPFTTASKGGMAAFLNLAYREE